MSEVDTSKAEADLANEKQAKENNKISDLESKLKAYEDKEKAEIAEAEAKKEKDILARLEASEKAREEDRKAFNDKIETLSTRQSSGKMSKDKQGGLTREEFDANKDGYLQMLTKDLLGNN